ncbi:MAG: sensor histidine kinase [Dehalobacterium sp.]
MRIIIKEIDEKVNGILGICDHIRSNEGLQELMAQEDLKEEKADEHMKSVSQLLRQYAYSRVEINSIFAFGLAKQVYDPLYRIPPYDEIISQFQAFDDFIVSKKFNAFSAPSTFPTKVSSNSDREKNTITYFSQYLSNYDFNQLGYILINLRKDYFFRDLDQICRQVFDFTYVIDEKGNIIYKVREDSDLDHKIIQNYGLRWENASEIQKINNVEYYVISQPLEAYPDWRVVGGVTYGKVKEDAALIQKIVYLIGLISVIIAMVIAYILSKKITDPILAINHAMAQFEQRQWPDKLEVKTEDELKSLINGFNHMVLQFRNLLDQVHQEHEEKKKVEVETLELKLDLLQAQINPHFIHNTLNAIKYLALKRGAEDILEMIQSFNLLLRASMSVGRDFISVQEELDCVESYLKIQRYRYDNDVQAIYEIDEGLASVQIPKLILQPIVENALYHGIIPKDAGGMIYIRVQENQGRILVSVMDDGIGICEEDLSNILRENAISEKRGFNNIGLNNINARLKLCYGEEYNLNIQSEPGKGTCVWFSIPKVEKITREE